MFSDEEEFEKQEMMKDQPENGSTDEGQVEGQVVDDKGKPIDNGGKSKGKGKGNDDAVEMTKVNKDNYATRKKDN